MTSAPTTDATEPTIEVLGVDQREAWRAGTLPPAQEVAPGTWSLPIVFPDNPLRYTLCYLLEDSGGPVLIDPGCHSDVGVDAIRAAVSTTGYRLADVAGVVITHAHMDHHGLSAAVLAESGAWMGMHPDEQGFLFSTEKPPPSRDEDRQWLHACGVPEDIGTTFDVSAHVRQHQQMPSPTIELLDGNLLPMTDRRIRAVWTPGHTPGHLCYYDEKNEVFFSGDHILPRISPHIGSQTRNAPKPLARYLDSLEKVKAFDSAQVLPGHEWRFRGLALRAGELQAHHAHRCQEIITALAADASATAWTLTTRLTWSRGWDSLHGLMRRMAMAETVSHLDYLEGLGDITGRADDVGRVHYSVAHPEGQ